MKTELLHRSMHHVPAHASFVRMASKVSGPRRSRECRLAHPGARLAHSLGESLRFHPEEIAINKNCKRSEARPKTLKTLRKIQGSDVHLIWLVANSVLIDTNGVIIDWLWMCCLLIVVFLQFFCWKTSTSECLIQMHPHYVTLLRPEFSLDLWSGLVNIFREALAHGNDIPPRRRGVPLALQLPSRVQLVLSHWEPLKDGGFIILKIIH